MSKPKMMGYNKPCIPNSRADLLRRNKPYLRQKEIADGARARRTERKEAAK